MNLWVLNMKEHIDLSKKEQRKEFYKALRKDIKAYDSDYQNIIKRDKALAKVESERIEREIEASKVFEELEDCRS